MIFNLKIKQKDNGNPIDTLLVCVVMHTRVTRSIFNHTHSPNEIGHYSSTQYLQNKQYVLLLK